MSVRADPDAVLGRHGGVGRRRSRCAEGEHREEKRGGEDELGKHPGVCQLRSWRWRDSRRRGMNGGGRGGG